MHSLPFYSSKTCLRWQKKAGPSLPRYMLPVQTLGNYSIASCCLPKAKWHTVARKRTAWRGSRNSESTFRKVSIHWVRLISDMTQPSSHWELNRDFTLLCRLFDRHYIGRQPGSRARSHNKSIRCKARHSLGKADRSALG